MFRILAHNGRGTVSTRDAKLTRGCCEGIANLPGARGAQSRWLTLC